LTAVAKTHEVEVIYAKSMILYFILLKTLLGAK